MKYSKKGWPMRIAVWMILFGFTVALASEVKLTDRQAEYIAQKVWQNEGAGQDKYLVHWNDGENFASVGIGHFIWFSAGHSERFREVFPMVLAYLEHEGVKMPLWLNSKTPLPWDNKESFFHAKNTKSKQYRELFAFLKETQSYQARFMAKRLNEALPQMLETLNDPKQKALIRKRFDEVMRHPDGSVNERGIYVLLDYTNFKGEGTLESERYKGEGWGLLQVLKHMDPKEPYKLKAFADAAKAMLDRRIRNSPPARGEERWRKGWFVRLDTYWK